MKTNMIRWTGAAVFVVIWAVLTFLLWFSPAKEQSETERRELKQFPNFTLQGIWDRSYMEEFEAAAPDQFPLRDTFRSAKALFRYYALNQAETNGIYLREGYAVKILYPMDQTALDQNLEKLRTFYEQFLKQTDTTLYVSVIPDKNYYLGPKYGYPTMDYEQFFSIVRNRLPWAQYVDLTGTLDISDYYDTDIHWRQEKLLETAGALAHAMGVTPPAEKDFTKTAIEVPFRGVYDGHAALPMAAETMYVLENEMLNDCTVKVLDDNSIVQVYDMGKLDSKDLYDIFLSGPRSLVVIENPNAKTERELVIFRDSFGSSMAPLLVQDYAKVTLVDLRYVPNPMVVANLVGFDDQDVLFLYCTEVLNTPNQLK